MFAAPWAMNSSWFDYQIAALSDRGLRCIAYDRRGHGRSPEPATGYDFDTLADDLEAVIEQLDLRDVTLVGQSMGCGEIARYLSRRPARVARAVLVSTITPFLLKTADNPDGFDEAIFEQGRSQLAKDRVHQVAKAAPDFFGVPHNTVSAEIMEWWTRIIVDQCSLRVMLELTVRLPAPTSVQTCERSPCRCSSSMATVTSPRSSTARLAARCRCSQTAN